MEKPKTLNLLLFSCKLMKHPASSTKYKTVYLKWPLSVEKHCPACQSNVEKAYPDSGKLIRTFDGVINQIIYHKDMGMLDSPFSAEQIKVCPYVGKAIKKLKELGYLAIIMSNQPGIEKDDFDFVIFDKMKKKVRAE